MGRKQWKNPKSLFLNHSPQNWILVPLPKPPTAHCQQHPLLTQCISCQHLQHNLHLKHLLLKLRQVHLRRLSKTLGNQWPLFKLLSLHLRHWQLLMLHGTSDGTYQNRLGSNLEHLDLSNYTSSTSSGSLQRLEKLVWGGLSLSHFFYYYFLIFWLCFIYFIFIFFSLDFLQF